MLGRGRQDRVRERHTIRLGQVQERSIGFFDGFGELSAFSGKNGIFSSSTIGSSANDSHDIHVMKSAATVMRYLPQVMGWIVLCTTLIVLGGWAFDLRGLQSLYPGGVTMKANTALGLALSAGALLLIHGGARESQSGRLKVRFFALLVILIGGGTVAEYLLRMNLGIDQLVFRAPHDVLLTPTPGRMAARHREHLSSYRGRIPHLRFHGGARISVSHSRCSL